MRKDEETIGPLCVEARDGLIERELGRVHHGRVSLSCHGSVNFIAGGLGRKSLSMHAIFGP